MAEEYMIQIQNVYKRFGVNQVLNGLNLMVRKGETKAIIGRSGVGKSVLLKSIMGLIEPDKGSIKVFGKELTTMNERDYNSVRMRIGLVFQGGALFDSMTVGENVAFVLDEFKHMSGSEKQRRVREALDMVGLDEIEDMMPANLSGGMRKRVGLARVVCMRPEIILYDEPTSEVDPITATTLNQLIIKMRDTLGVTSLVVTHDMSSAFQIADSIAMFYHGQVIADCRPENIRDSKHPVVKQFITGNARGPITDGENMVYGHVK